MKIPLRKRVFALTLAIAACFAANAYSQSTKPVILERKGDVIRHSLPTATDFFVKETRLSDNDYAKIKAQGNFSPQVSKLKFFYGEDAAGTLVGTVLFNSIKTSRGTIEVGIVFTPGGTVSNVVVTRATIGTKPWVKAVVDAGLLQNFIGIGSKSMSDPLKNISESELGARPYHIAQVIATAVIRGVVYYDVLFRRNPPR